MTTTRSVYRFSIAVLASVPVLILLQLTVLGRLPDSDMFMPHIHCYLDNSGVAGLHAASDALIGLSYIAISATIAYLIARASRSIPFPWIFLAFGLFIIACGATHIMEVITLWEPLYWLSGGIKLVTAVASVTTALILPPLVPRVMGVIDEADLSEQRRAELEIAYARLRESEELRTQFFANVSHELRTPLALILGPVQKLLAGTPASDGSRQDLEVIERNARLLLKHVNDLLDASTIEAGRMEIVREPTDIAELARRVVAQFDSSAQAGEVRFDLPQRLVANVDPRRIEQVLINLIANAVKFSGPEGRVVVSGASDGRTIRLEVRDNGPGIPPESRDQIFERFRQLDGGATRRHGGIGLGLAIVRELVELHDGTIRVDDAPEGGARFVVEIPHHHVAGNGAGSSVTTGDLDVVPEAPPMTDASLSGAEQDDRPCVLVVEDSDDLRAFVAGLLSHNYRVVTARDGNDGLRVARETMPDLMLTDVMMPGAGGEELIAGVRSEPRLASIPIVVLSARSDRETTLRLLRSGVQDYVVKPFEPEELLARVDGLLSLGRARMILQEAVDSEESDVVSLATELVALRSDLEQALASRDRFLAMLSHELRTPLTPVLNALMVLEEVVEGADRELVLMALRNLELEIRLIDDLLDLTRLTTGRLEIRPEPTDLHLLLRESVASLPELTREGLELDVKLEAGDPNVQGDPHRLQQLFRNLLVNAARFTHQGTIAISTSDGDHGVVIVLNDTGIGIDPEHLEKIFVPFEQSERVVSRAHGGLGLGLAIARMIAELHGGTITAHSDGPGRGARFVVVLPRG